MTENRRSIARLCAAACLLTAGFSVAAPQGGVDWMMQTNRLERSVAARTGLPNVLILGDSISIGYTPFVRKLLDGRANVSRPKCNCGASQFYLREKGGMRDWTAAHEKWDAIVVGFCIWDICYVKGDVFGIDHFWGDNALNGMPPHRKGTAIRDRGYRVRTGVPEYAANLRRIISFLKTKSDRVVFALGTPVPAYADDRCGLVRAYNDVAAHVCRELGVEVLDLYAVAERNYDKQKDGCHFNDEGNAILAEAVVKCLEKKGVADEKGGKRQ